MKTELIDRRVTTVYETPCAAIKAAVKAIGDHLPETMDLLIFTEIVDAKLKHLTQFGEVVVNGHKITLQPAGPTKKDAISFAQCLANYNQTSYVVWQDVFDEYHVGTEAAYLASDGIQIMEIVEPVKQLIYVTYRVQDAVTGEYLTLHNGCLQRWESDQSTSSADVLSKILVACVKENVSPIVTTEKF